ncbi:uncharacterized protein LOC118755175 [Rhagoletis pomonella]|uniref:uncharacterized protein LOC118755175 n=1 Tax=Rhagoletis pomonella TaxID=28610 RepID=UPI00177AAC59|nr:uncharacterized protein LOC118755175 [Rhagoletis pomonella]
MMTSDSDDYDDFDPDFLPEDYIECGETTDTSISQCLEAVQHCDTSSAICKYTNLALNVNSIEQEEPASTISAGASFKPNKRHRSPLPEIEIYGPTCTPSHCVFSGKNLTDIDIKEFQQILWEKSHYS